MKSYIVLDPDVAREMVRLMRDRDKRKEPKKGKKGKKGGKEPWGENM